METQLKKANLDSPTFNPLRPPGDGKSPERQAQIITVTPKMADEWLERNNHNRSLSRTFVRRYVEMMQKGKWMLSPDAIAFDQNGRLINGQHRLHAVVESETEQTFIVSIGHSSRVFEVADQGRKRNLKQALKLDGFTHVSRLASTTRKLYNFESGSLEGRANVNTPDGLAFAKYHCPELLESVKETQSICDDSRHLWRDSVINFLYYAMKWRSEKNAWKFVSGVATGLGLTNTDDPRYRLRDRLIEEVNKPGGRFDRKLELALSCKAVNKFFEDETVSFIRWSPGMGEDFPYPEVGDDYPFGFFD